MVVKNPHAKVQVPERVSVLWTVAAVAIAIALGLSILQLNQMRGLYQKEVANASEIQESYNKLLAEQDRKALDAYGLIQFRAKATPFVVNVPDSYRFIVKDDSVVKRIALTEVELAKRTEDETVLSEQARDGSINIRAHQDVFGSANTVEWVKNEMANQIDTTMFIEEQRIGDTWQVLKEPNNFAGHKISYFLLKNGIGYRVVFYQLGSFTELEEKARQIMNGFAITL